MGWFCLWMIALWNSEQGAMEATDSMKPAASRGNFWGPAATRARRYFNDWGYNTQFVVVLPSGHIDQVSQNPSSRAPAIHWTSGNR